MDLILRCVCAVEHMTVTASISHFFKSIYVITFKPLFLLPFLPVFSPSHSVAVFHKTAIDAPRFCIIDGTQNGTVLLEDGFHPDTISKLQQMGHKIRYGVAGHNREVFGRAQIIVRDRKMGVLCAGSDGRADGCALGYWVCCLFSLFTSSI